MKGDVVAVKEVIGNLGRLVEWLARVFGVGSDIDTAENDLTAGWVNKLAVFNDETKWSHGGC